MATGGVTAVVADRGSALKGRAARGHPRALFFAREKFCQAFSGIAMQSRSRKLSRCFRVIMGNGVAEVGRGGGENGRRRRRYCRRGGVAAEEERTSSYFRQF